MSQEYTFLVKTEQTLALEDRVKLESTVINVVFVSYRTRNFAPFSTFFEECTRQRKRAIISSQLNIILILVRTQPATIAVTLGTLNYAHAIVLVLRNNNIRYVKPLLINNNRKNRIVNTRISICVGDFCNTSFLSRTTRKFPPDIGTIIIFRLRIGLYYT